MGWKDAPEVTSGSPAWLSAPEVSATAPTNVAGSVMRGVRDIGAGMVRGAGSIGATILGARDSLEQGIANAMGAKGYVAGVPNRRVAMDDALRELVGANPDSLAYKGGKLTSEVAGTLGVGGALAGGAGAAGAAPAVVNALRTAGMSTGAPQGALASLLTRAGAGAATGAASAGLVNPEDAGMGALIGGAAPGLIQGAGKLGSAAGRAFRGPEQSDQIRRALGTAGELGLVVPPTQANASLKNRLLEGTAGKLTTAQNASAKNASTIKDVIARDLGLPPGTELNAENIGFVKKAAGTLYDAVSNAGVVQPGSAYSQALDKIVEPHMRAAAGFPNAKQSPVVAMIDSLRSEAFDAASAVAKIKELRSAADDAFKPGGQGADVGRAAKSAAKAMEDALEGHLKAIGEPDLLDQFRKARVLYAKASTADKAINQATGTIDARKLAAELQKKKPLSGDMRKVAEVASQFPTAFKTPEQMGSLPQFSPLDLYGGAGIAGIGGALTGNPLAALGLALPLVRTGARNAALSPRVQRSLIQTPKAIKQQSALQQLLMRSAPVALSE